MSDGKTGPRGFGDDKATAVQAAMGLRKLAAHPILREKFSKDDTIKRIFAAPASRYIIGSTIAEACRAFDILAEKGYRTGVEYVGEDISHEKQVCAVVAENIRFLTGSRGMSFAGNLQLGFDLSSVGLLVSRDLAVDNTRKIAGVAAAQGCSIMISMERTTLTDQILDIFYELAPHHENLGITVQAYLKRLPNDLPKLLKTGRKLRLVKGVYDEHISLALPRGTELDELYVEYASVMAAAGTTYSIATHDRSLIEKLRAKGLLNRATEIEALHGCNPDLYRGLKSEGLPCRITGVYGEEWFLHFLHRLAEHTPNILQAIADFYEPERVVFGKRY